MYAIRSYYANAICYEALIADEAQLFDWPQLDENTAAALCYTSGTTGNPKGTLYSHRAIVLHAFGLCAADSAMALSSHEIVLPAVSMFHVHAWGIPYAAAMCGAKLVLPGPNLDGQNLYELIESERVTVTAGRITSYNVCYTKLLRNRAPPRSSLTPSYILSCAPLGRSKYRQSPML